MGKHKHLWKYKHVQESHPDDRVGRTCRAVVCSHNAQTLGQHLQKKTLWSNAQQSSLIQKIYPTGSVKWKSVLLPKLSICETAGLFYFVLFVPLKQMAQLDERWEETGFKTQSPMSVLTGWLNGLRTKQKHDCSKYLSSRLNNCSVGLFVLFY